MKITDAHLKQIYAHAIETYPQECCGFLLGHDDHPGLVCAVKRAVNQSQRPDRFVISAEEFARAWLAAEEFGQVIMGIYHSHPDAPAIPSQLDLDNAWEDACFLITSLYQGRPLHTGVWQLAGRDSRRRFTPAALEIIALEALVYE